MTRLNTLKKASVLRPFYKISSGSEQQQTKSTAHSCQFTVGHACLSFYFPDVLSQAAVAILFATCRIIRNPPINGSLPVIVHKRSRSFHKVRSDQNLNTATPYAGRSYANEYGLPSHSLFSALYISGCTLPLPPNCASSLLSTSLYCLRLGTPTR